MSKPNKDFMSAIRFNRKITLLTKQINQLSSTFDQMAKILDHIKDRFVLWKGDE